MRAQGASRWNNILIGVLAGAVMSTANAEIVFLAPPSVETVGVTAGYDKVVAGYALQRGSVVTHSPSGSAIPLSADYWLVLPRAADTSTSADAVRIPSDRAINARSQAVRANAYRRKIFER